MSLDTPPKHLQDKTTNHKKSEKLLITLVTQATNLHTFQQRAPTTRGVCGRFQFDFGRKTN